MSRPGAGTSQPSETHPLFDWQHAIELKQSRFGAAPAVPTHDDWGPLLIPARNLTVEKVRTTKLTLVVTAQGRPVRATWNMDGTGRVSGQLQAVSIDLDLKYSRWGVDVTIAKP